MSHKDLVPGAVVLYDCNSDMLSLYGIEAFMLFGDDIDDPLLEIGPHGLNSESYDDAQGRVLLTILAVIECQNPRYLSNQVVPEFDDALELLLICRDKVYNARIIKDQLDRLLSVTKLF